LPESDLTFMPEKETIKIGMIGLGFMGVTHLKAWAKVPGARVTALCNPSGRHLDGDFTDVSGNVGDKEPLKLNMTEVSAYRSYREMLNDPTLDAIDICTPTHTHEELAIEALHAGKHVICEKPMARTSAQAIQMMDEARRAKRVLMPAMCLRFWPEWAWLKEAVQSQRFGRVLSARFTRIAEPPGWGRSTFLNGELSGGALLDLHIHDADFICHLFGAPLIVESGGYSLLSGSIDHIVTRYAVNGGALVHAEGGWTMAKGFGFRMAYTVNFEKGTADYDLARGDQALKFSSDDQTNDIKCEGPDGYVGQLTHFAEAIRKGEDPTRVNAEDGVQSILLCEAEERSIELGLPVKVAASSSTTQTKN
jgi:predicted dehydrogenase